MKPFLRAGLVAGIVYAVLGLVFVHVVLSAERRQELERVFASAVGSGPDGGGVGEVVLHLLLRVLFGFVTMAAFAVLHRKRPRARAAWTAGVAVWLVGYVAWPLYLLAVHGLSFVMLLVCIVYGLLETQVAAHSGSLAWPRRAAAAPAPAGGTRVEG